LQTDIWSDQFLRRIGWYANINLWNSLSKPYLSLTFFNRFFLRPIENNSQYKKFLLLLYTQRKTRCNVLFLFILSQKIQRKKMNIVVQN
jgi:hypothetical protein